MRALYDVGIRLYATALKLAAPFNAKAKEWVRGRHLWQEKLKAQRKPGQKYIWFHCASLGEFEQGRPVMERIAADFSAYKIIISFFSPSGYVIRKDYALADIVCYLPLDTAANAGDFLEIVQPELAVFVKYEVWPAFFEEIKVRKIPLVMLSATFREKHRYFRSNGSWLLDLLKIPHHIFVQNESSLKLLREHGIETGILSGDTRFDRVFELQQSAVPVDKVEIFCSGRKILIFGSCWEQEDEVATALIGRLPEDYCLLMVPHDIGKARIGSLKLRFGKQACLFSDEKPGIACRVMIVDSIGLLGRMYKSSVLAVVGGGFRGALHNILEAAAYGIPVCFGSNHSKYPEAKALKEAGGSFEDANPAGLANQILDILKDTDKMRMMGASSRAFVESGRGATDRVIRVLINSNLLIK